MEYQRKDAEVGVEDALGGGAALYVCGALSGGDGQPARWDISARMLGRGAHVLRWGMLRVPSVTCVFTYASLVHPRSRL